MSQTAQTPQTSFTAPAWPPAFAQIALDASHNLLFVLDRAGTILHVNRAALHMLCVQADQVIGTDFVQGLDEGSRAKGLRLLEQAQAGSPTAEFELNQLASNNAVMMIGYTATLLPHTTAQNSDAPHILLVGRPLAATIAGTERLVGLNRRLNALFSIAASASRSLVLNDVLEEALSVASAELDLRAGAVFLIDTPDDLADAQTLPLEFGQLRLVAQQGFAPHFVDQLARPEHLAAFWNPDIRAGQPVVIQGTIEDIGIQPTDLVQTTGPLLSVAATPLHSENRVIGWLYAVTDRYRAWERDEQDLLSTIGNLLGPPIANARLHDALLQTAGRLQAVLDGIDSGVLLVDQDGVVRYANARLGALFHTDVSTWPGRLRQDVQPPALHKFVQPALPPDVELWELAGPPRLVLRRFSAPIHDSIGTPIGSIEVFSDITELDEMNRLKDEFVAGAAHDLKTPVTAVKGYAQIALRMARRGGDEKLVQQLAMINARSDELRHLMDALLDMSRIQGGRMILDLEKFSLQPLLNKVVAHFEFDLNRRGREIMLDVPEAPVEVFWDPTRIESVLINLISNAIKYSPDGGPVEIAVQISDNRSVRLSVTDHGIGIPEEERERIFERFYRVRSTIDNHFKGTGIGLYITHIIVELHHGRIWADAALHGGQGTTMFVELPRNADQPPVDGER